MEYNILRKEGASTRQTGAQKEESAWTYLQQKGVRILERNFHCRQGEIDLIGYDGEYLVFFEVKYRKDGSVECASEAVGIKKQKKICKVCDYYRMIHRCSSDTPVRFDVIAIDGNHIQWIQDAFSYWSGGAL